MNLSTIKLRSNLGKKTTKYKVIKGTIFTGVVIVGMAAIVTSCSNKEQPVSPTVSANNVIKIENIVETEPVVEKAVLKATVNFDPEDKELLTTTLTNFIVDNLENGLGIKYIENITMLEEYVYSLIDAYIVLNNNELTEEYYSNLYQTEKDYNDVLTNYWSFAISLRDDAMTSSYMEGTVVDVTSLIANKKDAEFVQIQLDLIGKLNDAVRTNDKTKVQDIVDLYSEKVVESLMSSDSYRYDKGVLDLSYRLMMTTEQLAYIYHIEIVDKDLRQLLNEDNFNICKEIENSKTNGSAKNTNYQILLKSLAENLENIDLEKDYTEEKSANDIVIEVSKNIRTLFIDGKLPQCIENSNLDDLFLKYGEKSSSLSNNSSKSKGSNSNSNVSNTTQSTQPNVVNQPEQVPQAGTVLETEYFDNNGVEVTKDESDLTKKGIEEGSAKGALDGGNKNMPGVSYSFSSSNEKYQTAYINAYNESYNSARTVLLNAMNQNNNTNSGFQPTNPEQVGGETVVSPPTEVSPPPVGYEPPKIEVPPVENNTPPTFVPVEEEQVGEDVIVGSISEYKKTLMATKILLQMKEYNLICSIDESSKQLIKTIDNTVIKG